MCNKHKTEQSEFCTRSDQKDLGLTFYNFIEKHYTSMSRIPFKVLCLHSYTLLSAAFPRLENASFQIQQILFYLLSVKSSSSKGRHGPEV